MTIDEAIKHCEEIAKEQRELFSLCPIPSDMCDPNKDCASLKNGKNRGCLKCAEEHEQLAEWLKDYKKLRQKDAQIKDAISRCKMQKLAQDEISSFEHMVLKIYGVME